MVTSLAYNAPAQHKTLQKGIKMHCLNAPEKKIFQMTWEACAKPKA